MRHRLILGRFLIRLGSFIQSLAVVTMRPDDLVTFGLETYAKNVESLSRKELLEVGLNPEEKTLVQKLPMKKGQLLLLGVGGGREAIPLAKMGFKVTGLDFVPEMVEKARENALRQGLKIKGLTQEISRLEAPANYYDVVWLSAAMYSCVPTRKRRIEMLKRIGKALKPRGYFVCQFSWNSRSGSSRKVEVLRRAFGFISLGNMWYEQGDMLSGNVEFLHQFSSEHSLKLEFKEGGFEVVFLYIPEGAIRGGAVLMATPLYAGIPD